MWQEKFAIIGLVVVLEVWFNRKNKKDGVCE